MSLANSDRSHQNHLSSLFKPIILEFSADDEMGIRRQTKEYVSYFSKLTVPLRYAQHYINDLAFTLSFRRSFLPWRSFAVVRSTDDLSKLDKAVSVPKKALSDPGLGFIFTGQGAQWAGMGRDLMEFPTFKRFLHESEQFLLGLGCPWYLCEEMMKQEMSNINQPQLAQPICTAIQIALVDLLRQFEIEPVVVVGHSSGEIAAAYCVGAVTTRSALKLAYYRGALAGSLATSNSTKGCMMSVGLSKDQVLPYLDRLLNQFDHRGLTIACINSPKNVTVSGDEDQMTVLKALLDGEKIFTRKLLVDVAYHSPHMEPIAEDYRKKIGELEQGTGPSKPATMISSVTGEVVKKSRLISPDYWVSNVISSVRFADAVENLVSKSVQRVRRKLDLSHRSSFHVAMLVEVGPHSVLQGPINDILAGSLSTVKMDYVSLLKRGVSATSSLLNAIGQIRCLGCSVNIEQVNRLSTDDSKSHMVLPDLPEYVFDHSKKYWQESRTSTRYRTHHQGKLDLLGKPLLDWNPVEPRWRNFLRISEMPWIEDHVISGSLIYPGSAMLVMVIEAANQISNVSHSVVGFEFREVDFLKSINISQDSNGIETQLSIQMAENSSQPLDTWSRFRLYAYNQDAWHECCQGFVRVRFSPNYNNVNERKEDIEEQTAYRQLRESMVQSCKTSFNPHEFYETLGRSGFGLGPSFQRITAGTFGDQKQAVGNIKLYEWPQTEYPQAHIIHPTTLDAIFHFGISGFTRGGQRRIATMVPSHLRSLFVHKAKLSFPENTEIQECA